jgi:outer membrane protein TolC
MLLTHYEGLAQARYAGGQGLQQAVLKIQSEITKILNRLETLNQQRLSLAAKLNSLMDRAPDRPIPEVEPPGLPSVNLPLEELCKLGEENRQELKAVRALIGRSEKALALSQKDRWPAFTIGATFINVGRRDDPAGRETPPPDNGKNAFSLSVGLTIPLWGDKYDAGVQDAVGELSAERYRYSHLRNNMELAIRDLASRLETLQRQVSLFEGALIPQAEETLHSTEAAYETGQLGVLDLLDSERILLELRLARARLHSDYLGALAALERALGTQFPTA